MIDLVSKNKSNEGALLYLQQKPYTEFNKDVSPQGYTQNKWSLNCHPDVAKMLWEDFAVKLPVDCRWILFGTPVLLRPDTGIVFGIAEDVNPPLLRFSESDKLKVLICGGKEQLLNLDGVYADAKQVGKDWVYCFSFLNNIEELCFQSFINAV
jgi:hypothetical protein